MSGDSSADVAAQSTALMLASLVGAVVLAAVVRVAFRSTKAAARRHELAALAARRVEVRNAKRETLRALLAKHSEACTLTPKQLSRLARLPAAALAAAVREGDLSRVTIMTVFCMRALKAGEELGAVAEEFYDEALARAAELDAAADAGKEYAANCLSCDSFTATASLVPSTADEDEDDGSRLQELARAGRLLEGVPVSIKDCLLMKGADNTMGLAVRCFKPSQEDSHFVSLLRQQGAIPFVRGNVPQSLMLPECDNNVWGLGRNPWNRERTPGGSSGGEGALVAMRAAPIAIGTDIGGSVRIPAAYCGVFGLKPTPQRLTHHGKTAPRPKDIDGQPLIVSTAGPLANSVEDLTLVMRAWLVPEMWRRDPTVPPVPFSEHLYRGVVSTVADAAEARAQGLRACVGRGGARKKLRIGYYAFDGFAASAPTGARAVETAVKALRALGHECVPFTPPRVADAMVLYIAIMGADGDMAGFRAGLDGEALHPAYSRVATMASLGRPLRAVLAALLRAMGQPNPARLTEATHGKTAQEHWADGVEFVRYCREFHTAWAAAGLDAVVCPGTVLPAVAHGMSRDILPMFTHSFLWNMVHYPVGALPVTTVRADELDYSKAEGAGTDAFNQAAAEALKGAEGMPFGVQIAARPYHDELVLRLMKELEGAGVGKGMVPPAAELIKD